MKTKATVVVDTPLDHSTVAGFLSLMRMSPDREITFTSETGECFVLSADEWNYVLGLAQLGLTTG